MEQPETPDDLLRSVYQPPRRRPESPTLPPATSHLASSEPTPEPRPIGDLSDSVLSLRFPRPAGNRQLTNWISSSSPDIMQPGSVPDEEPSLAELGYDIIGTDGESQAESIASSFDYQKSDDIQSLAGTDVDTDSSDDEETTLHETTISDATIVEGPHDDERDAAEVETLNMMNRSLENPTSLSFSGLSPFSSLTYLDRIRTHEPDAVLRGPPSGVEDLSFMGQGPLTGPLTIKELERSDSCSPQTTSHQGFIQPALKCLHEKRRILATLAGLVLVYTFALVTKSLLISTSVARELSTVPVASVPVVVPSSSAKTAYSLTVTSSTKSQTPNALQTASSPNSLLFIPFGRDDAGTEVAAVPPPATVCSAELFSRDQIMIKIPQSVKSSWLAKDAIWIAVSRGLQDIPTKVSSVDDGLLIRVPLKEAHGVLAVTVATTRKPRINQVFPIHFGGHRLTEALDAGKQLVRGFAQKVVDTVNETTSWVEETYIPALDVVSKQVCGQTASISGSVLHGFRDVVDAILAIPSRLIAPIQHSLRAEVLHQRASQLRLELARETENVRDDVRMAVLVGRVHSRLLWLKLRGKVEEHGHYLSKVEIHLKEQRARVELAKAERAERTKKQIGAWRERDRQVTKETFWSTMAAWAGLEE
ncbi:hypothetical protein F5Y14DRAFT_436464 [Nemania sp. NC0429]|nr:hypothetical protein F5Y14DRAFT_436464 [Nemania sp. NC0429]